MKFSFIIPVYNVEKYLEKCLTSIFNQTYKDYEVICINDGSTDSSLQILNEYKERYPSLIIVDQKNSGLGAARNSGVQYANGDYIWFVDSDDWVEEIALEVLNDFIQNDCGYKDVILFDCYRAFENGNKVADFSIPNYTQSSLDAHYYISYLLNKEGLFAAWLKVFKREKFQNSNYKFVKGFYEDIPLLVYYFEQECSFAYCKNKLYNYFIRDNSIMRTADIRVLDIFQQFDIVKNCIGKDTRYRKDISSFFYRLMVNTIFKVVNADNEVIVNFIKMYKSRYKEYGYFTTDCFFNSKISLKRKLSIIKHIILPILTKKI